MTAVVAGMIPFFGIMQRFADEAARVTGQPDIAQLPLEIARSLPYNVTTEMDLALWQTAVNLRADPEAAQLFAHKAAAELAARYLDGRLPLRPGGGGGLPGRSTVCAAWVRSISAAHAGANSPSPSCRCCRATCASTILTMAPDKVFARGGESAARRRIGWKPPCGRHAVG